MNDSNLDLWSVSYHRHYGKKSASSCGGGHDNGEITLMPFLCATGLFSTTSIRRQEGQQEEEWDPSNHLSMHSRWNTWLHPGNTLISSPSTNSPKHMTHSANVVATSALADLKVRRGSDSTTALFKEADGAVAAWWWRRRRRHVQRATAMRPTMQMRAQMRQDKMMAMSEFTGTGGSAVIAGDEEREVLEDNSRLAVAWSLAIFVQDLYVFDLISWSLLGLGECLWSVYMHRERVKRERERERERERVVK